MAKICLREQLEVVDSAFAEIETHPNFYQCALISDQEDLGRKLARLEQQKETIKRQMARRGCNSGQACTACPLFA